MTDCIKSRRVYACSGCADVGEIADQVCRTLRRDGTAQPTMSCLAGIAAHMPTFIDAATKVDEVIAIDGCQVACAKKVMEHAELTAKSIILTDFGLEKGKTQVSPAIIAEMCVKTKEKI